MLKSRSVGLRCVVLSLVLGLLLPILPLYADDAPEDLPPPPPSEDAGLTPIDDSAASAGADLPPPPVPGEPEAPTSAASAADTAPPPDATAVETPPGEEMPPLPADDHSSDQATSSEVPPDAGLTEVPQTSAPRLSESPDFSSTNELNNLSMGDRIKSKDLVLWLSLGPSYGQLTTKGSYAQVASTAGTATTIGGLGYNAGIGCMVNNAFQFQFDFTGTPKTRDSTVDQAMFGFGPRLGFLTLMGTFGVQAGPDPTQDGNPISQIFVIGARAGLDLVLSHSPDSRTSIGLSPEVYFITPQGADGYASAGVTVSLRLYGYENAF